jgi:hypothetical protein
MLQEAESTLDLRPMLRSAHNQRHQMSCPSPASPVTKRIGHVRPSKQTGPKTRCRSRSFELIDPVKGPTLTHRSMNAACQVPYWTREAHRISIAAETQKDVTNHRQSPKRDGGETE